MEILYIYIHDYKKIQKQNINFGGKYRFHYDYESKELTVSENHQYIEGFYDKHQNEKGYAKITNVTSIIGENGVGKTTILDFIFKNFVYGDELSSAMICAFKNDDVIQVFNFDLEISRSIALENFDAHGFKFQISKIEREFLYAQQKKSKLYFNPKFGFTSQTEIIMLTNVFNNSIDNFEFLGSRNLSTDFLMFKDFRSRVKSKASSHEIESAFRSHRFEEIVRQMGFLSSESFNQSRVPFHIPENLMVSLRNNRFVSKDSLNFFLDKSNTQNAVLQNYYEILNGINKFLQVPKRDFVSFITANAFMNYIEELFSNQQDFIITELKSFSKKLNDRIIKFNYDNIVDLIESTGELLNEFRFLSVESNIKVISSILGFHDFLIRNADTLSNLFPGYQELNEVSLNISVQETKFVRELYSQYKTTYLTLPYLDFDWRNLSSGEKSLLSIYSRFYSIISSELKGNLIILLDEPDTNLHPQWQKTLLNSLLDFLPEIYGRKDASGKKVKQRNIQIIFTTNNPISASDLLASNTVFMKLDNDKNVQIQDSLNDQRQTFGANIYSLYADSFFIQDGLMGKFASEKINAIIKTLNSLRPLNPEERETMRRTISQIGEPAIKNKLIQMYSDRFNMDIHERLDNIEKKLNKDDQDKPE